MHRRLQPHRDTAVLESNVGYRFRDAALLDLALTHPAYRHEHPEAEGDFERLEFLGDAVLGLLLAEQLYRQRPEADEGTLTVLRSQCASGRALSEIARAAGLDAFIKLGKGDDGPEQGPLPRYLGAALEALLGAAWMDGGLDAVRTVYARLFEPRVTALERDPWADNPKGELQALMQGREADLPVYAVVSVEGPPHAPRYGVTVTAGGWLAAGEGCSKQSAETAAAQAWLDEYRAALAHPRLRRSGRRSARDMLAGLLLLGLLAVSLPAATNVPPLYFVQISDTHRGKPLHAARLAAAIEQINALPQPVRFVLHTGDFASDDLRTETAILITNQLAGLKVPLFTVAGNHDILPRRLDETLAAYTNHIGPLACRMEVQGVQFLMVYTEPLRKAFHVPGYDPIGWVEAQLRAHPDLDTIIVTHAPDAEDFYRNRIHPGWPEAARQAWQAALSHGRVRAIITGHFHRDELHWNARGIPTYVASSIADFWGRQGTFRVYRYEVGRLSYTTVYIED